MEAVKCICDQKLPFLKKEIKNYFEQKYANDAKEDREMEIYDVRLKIPVSLDTWISKVLGEQYVANTIPDILFTDLCSINEEFEEFDKMMSIWDFIIFNHHVLNILPFRPQEFYYALKSMEESNLFSVVLTKLMIANWENKDSIGLIDAHKDEDYNLCLKICFKLLQGKNFLSKTKNNKRMKINQLPELNFSEKLELLRSLMLNLYDWEEFVDKMEEIVDQDTETEVYIYNSFSEVNHFYQPQPIAFTLKNESLESEERHKIFSEKKAKMQHNALENLINNKRNE